MDEGLPSGPCPLKKHDSSVVIGKGDLMLCHSCDTERRRLFDEACKAKTNRNASTRSRSRRNLQLLRQLLKMATLMHRLQLPVV